MDGDSAHQFRVAESIRVAANSLADHEKLLAKLNHFIRLYMQTFNDFFVEELTLLQIASNVPLQGVYTTTFRDGQLLENYGVVGKVPPVMFRPWLKHADQAEADFKAAIANAITLIPHN